VASLFDRKIVFHHSRLKEEPTKKRRETPNLTIGSVSPTQEMPKIINQPTWQKERTTNQIHQHLAWLTVNCQNVKKNTN
jgi:hypothetical protein